MNKDTRRCISITQKQAAMLEKIPAKSFSGKIRIVLDSYMEQGALSTEFEGVKNEFGELKNEFETLKKEQRQALHNHVEVAQVLRREFKKFCQNATR